MELLKSSVASFEAEYKDLVDVWKQLEVKGQGLVVIDGVLLTGSITFATKADTKFIGQHCELLTALLVGLFASIVMAVRVLRTQQVASAPYGQAYHSLVEPLFDLSVDEISARESNMYRDQIKLWRSVTASIRVQIRKKGDWLLYGQIAMFVALALLLVLFATVIFGVSP